MKHYQGVPRYRYAELADMPTLAVGQAEDLKVETTTLTGQPCRVWLSRTGPADGEPFRHTASVETFDQRTSQWNTLYQYDADRTSHTSGESNG